MKNIRKIGYILVLCAFSSNTNLCFPDSPQDLDEQNGLVFGDNDQRSRVQAISDFFKKSYLSAKDGFKDAENDEKAGLILTAASVLGVLLAGLGQFIGASKETAILLKNRFFVLKENPITGEKKDLRVQLFKESELPKKAHPGDIVFVLGEVEDGNKDKDGFKNGEFGKFVAIDEAIPADYETNPRPLEGGWVSFSKNLPSPPMNFPPSGSSKPFDPIFGASVAPIFDPSSSSSAPVVVEEVAVAEKDIDSYIERLIEYLRSSGLFGEAVAREINSMNLNEQVRRYIWTKLPGDLIKRSSTSASASVVEESKPAAEASDVHLLLISRPTTSVVMEAPAFSPAASSLSSSSPSVARFVEVVPAVDALPFDQIPFGQWSVEDAKGLKYIKIPFGEANFLGILSAEKPAKFLLSQANNGDVVISRQTQGQKKWIKRKFDGTKWSEFKDLSSLDEIFT